MNHCHFGYSAKFTKKNNSGNPKNLGPPVALQWPVHCTLNGVQPSKSSENPANFIYKHTTDSEIGFGISNLG